MVRAVYAALLACAIAACSFNSRKFDDRSCSIDSDCGRPDEACVSQVCTQRTCSTSADCGTGFAFTCNAMNACEVNTCQTNADCNNGFACSPDSYCQASFNVVSAAAVTNDSIAVTFDAPPDATTGKTLGNYVVSGLTLSGTPTITGSTVTITTTPQAAQNYSLTVNSVTRASDQAPLIISTATFSGRASFNVASAQAATSRSVLITFDSVPDPTAAMNLANYSVAGGLTLTGTPTVLGNTVILNTSPQAVTSYTLTVSNITRNGDGEPLTVKTAMFTGRTDFNVLSAQSRSSHSVDVTFDSAPNSVDATLLTNYTIPGLTLSGTPVLNGSTVTLTTSTQALTTYTASVANVRRGSDNQPLVVTSAQFTGTPPFNVASAAPASNTSITVTFDAPPVASEATTLGNYSVSGLTLSGTPTLSGNTVTITTTPQSVTSYTVTVTANAVHRASDLEPLTGNTANFTGRAAFDVASAAAVTAHSMSVTFDAQPNAAQATTLGNYSVSPSLTLSGTPTLSGNTVTITTSAQTATTYTVTVNGVTRNLDAEALTVNQAMFTGRATFNVTSAMATSSTSVLVTFDAAPNAAQGAMASNYTITGLTVSGAAVSGNTVTLTTSAQSSSTYTLNVAGVTRASDSEPLTNTATTFTGRIPFNVMAAAAPKAATLTVTFDAVPNAAQATNVNNYNVPGLTLGTTVTLSGSTVTLTTSAQLPSTYTVYVTGVTRLSDGEPLLVNMRTFMGRPAFDVVSAAATTSHNVQVTFDSAPNGTQATVAANYSIDNGVTVTAASYPGSGNVVTLTTSAQSSSTPFTVTVSNVTRSSDGEGLTIAVATFTGRDPFDVISAADITSTTFSLTFDAAPNSSQAGMKGNYSCPGIAISAVSYPGSGNTVTVTGSAQSATSYTCTVSGVTRASDAEPLSNTTASFTGRPTFNVASAASIGNTTITVTFDAAPEPVSAQTLANYAITVGSLSLSGTPTLNGNVVTITTSAQTAGASYTIKASNITRASDTEALTMQTATFMGKSGFNVVGATSKDATTMTVTYDAAPNGTQATTLTNYSVKDSLNNPLALSGTPTIAGNTVTITTASQAAATYTVTVINVTRLSDGVPLTVNTANFTHTTFNVASASAVNSHKVTVTFDAQPNNAQATTLTNYSIPGLTLSGTPTLNGNTVTLTTSSQTGGMTYTVTVSGVTRNSDGSPLTTNSAMFTGIATFNVMSASSSGSAFVKVVYDAPPTASQATNRNNYNIPGLNLSGSPVLSGNTVTIATSVQSAISYTVTVTNVTRAGDNEPLTTNTAMFTGTAQTAPTVTSVVVNSTNPNNGANFYNTGTATVTITGTQFSGTNCTTAPFGVKLNDTDGTGTVINTKPTNCTVNSDTQITATFPVGIVSNYAGWDVLVTNTAGTSGTAAADRLVVKAGLLVSEVYTGSSGAGGNLHEFVELYNPTATTLDVTNIGPFPGIAVSFHMRDGGGADTSVSISVNKKNIVSHGYFLLVSSESSTETWYSHRDATYSATTVNSTNGGLVSGGSVYVSLNSTAQSKVLDKFGWKGQPAGGYEGNNPLNSDINAGESSQRAPGNAGGDGTDTDSSSNDWNSPNTTITPMGTADGTLP
jgi:hypothetical protein